MSHTSIEPARHVAPAVVTGGADGASRLALLDPTARGAHAALTALGAQAAEHGLAMPYGVLVSDLVITLRDTAELRNRLARTKGATYPAPGNPAVRYYLQQVARLADTCAHARRAYLPGYDALSPDVIRIAVVASCRDAQGLELAIAYEPGNIEIALEVVANPTADRSTISQLVHRWVSAETTAPDEKRLAMARAVIESHGKDAELLDAVTDGLMHMVNHHDSRELEAAFEAARAAVLAQTRVRLATPELLSDARESVARRMAEVTPHAARGAQTASREKVALEMVHEAMTERLTVMVRQQRIPELAEAARRGERLSRKQARALADAGISR